MSSRLGRALAEHIIDLPGERKFVVVEGVEEDLAAAMAEAWQDDGLPLAIASAHPERFAGRALAGESGTALRNRGPVCLVICEGFQLPDRQSLRAFESVAPGDLLASHHGLALLARQPPEAPMDGPVRSVRGAIIQAGPAARPGTAAVAAYLDRCAAGEPAAASAARSRRVRRPCCWRDNRRAPLAGKLQAGGPAAQRAASPPRGRPATRAESARPPPGPVPRRRRSAWRSGQSCCSRQEMTSCSRC